MLIVDFQFQSHANLCLRLYIRSINRQSTGIGRKFWENGRNGNVEEIIILLPFGFDVCVGVNLYRGIGTRA